MSVGTLTARRVGPDIEFTMQLPTEPGPAGEPHDHFMVERFKGIEVNAKGERVEVWKPIHTGTRKHVAIDPTNGNVGVEWLRARRMDDLGNMIDNPDPVPGGRFRALALYRVHEPGTQVRVLHTHGQPTGEVVVA
jgi:hypothetical protein